VCWKKMSRRASLCQRAEKGLAICPEEQKRTSRVRFPDELVFLDDIKENDLLAAKAMLRRASIKIDINAIGDSGIILYTQIQSLVSLLTYRTVYRTLIFTYIYTYIGLHTYIGLRTNKHNYCIILINLYSASRSMSLSKALPTTASILCRS